MNAKCPYCFKPVEEPPAEATRAVCPHCHGERVVLPKRVPKSHGQLGAPVTPSWVGHHQKATFDTGRSSCPTKGYPMKTTTIHCDRCGATILGGHAVLEVKAGDLVKRHDAPLDLCGACAERFEDFLRGSHQGSPCDGLGAIEAPACAISR
jgi:DNA-directed RNA polymerase subunit RPC12/RpoP